MSDDAVEVGVRPIGDKTSGLDGTQVNDAAQEFDLSAEGLSRQYAVVAELMKTLEESLNDEQHELVARLMVELTAYNVMSTLRALDAEEAEGAIEHGG